MTSAIVYGDANLNLMDGSSVWIASIAEVLAGIVDEVHVLAKAADEDQTITGPLREVPGVRIHPHRIDSEGLALPGDPLSPQEATARIGALADSTGAALIIVRGFDACVAAAADGRIAARLWAYITDLQFPLSKVSARGVQRLRRVAAAARRMVAQTEAARSYLEAIAPEAAGKTVLLNPMVPDSAFRDGAAPADRSERPLRLVYMGKLANDWRTLEMLQLPAALRELGIDAELWVIGAKIQNDRTDPNWRIRMQDALQAAHDDPDVPVRWFGALPRAEAVDLAAQCDLGIGWRSPRLDSSLEVSSKLLEFSAAGVVPLMNRTADHETVWGADYPGLLEQDDVAHVAEMIAGMDAGRLAEARRSAASVASWFSMTASRDRLRAVLERSGIRPHVAITERPRRVLVATHDPKFLGELLDALRADPGIELRIDPWETLHTHDEDRSEELAAWADVILCEWAGPNAVWYSQRKRPDQKLVVRLHAFELRGPWLANLDVPAVDTWVVVSEEYRRRLSQQLDVPAPQITLLPNAVDVADLSRHKLPDSHFRLGLVGIVSYNKRPDRALDLLESLLEVDDRYHLHVKGRMPWEYRHEWDTKPVQRRLYEHQFQRLAASAELRRHVVFEDFSPDVASWLRKIGVVLSPSHLESFHLAPAEGMASGAVPVLWDRPGAREIFGDRFVVTTIDQAREAVLALRDDTVRRAETHAARAHVGQWDTPVLLEAWRRTLTQEENR